MTDGIRIPSSGRASVVLYDLNGPADRPGSVDHRPPLLVCHATGLHGRVYQPIADQLRDAFHVYAIDFRGHGDAVAPEGVELEWPQFADDVLAVVDHLGLDHLFAVGHSKGGAALLLSEQRRPGTFRALYLFEPIVPPSSRELPPGNPLAEGALRRRSVFPSFDATYENFSSKPPLGRFHPEALRAYVDHGFAEQPDGTVRLKCRPEFESEVYRTVRTHNAFDHLGAVRCPVTVGIGADEPYSPALFAPAIVEGLPHARLERYPELSHFGPLEDPVMIAGRIREALSGEAPAASPAPPTSPPASPASPG